MATSLAGSIFGSLNVRGCSSVGFAMSGKAWSSPAGTVASFSVSVAMSASSVVMPWIGNPSGARLVSAFALVLSDTLEGFTGGRIRGPENFIALNEGCPGTWRCTVQRIDERADGAVTMTKISDADTSLFAVLFFELRYGRIAGAEEYFADNGPPHHDRSAFAERL